MLCAAAPLLLGVFLGVDGSRADLEKLASLSPRVIASSGVSDGLTYTVY